MNATLRGKPDAGNPHVRFDEGEVASAKPRRGSLLYKRLVYLFLVCAGLGSVTAGTITWSKNAAGTYDFLDNANWTGGVLPGDADTAQFNAPAGDQVIQGAESLDVAPRLMDLIFLNRSNVNTATRTRTIEGCLQVDGTNWFKTGITRISGTVTGGPSAMTRVATSGDALHDATLVVDGRLQASEAGALWVGAHANSGAANPSSGRIILEGGGEIDYSSVSNDGNSGLSLGRQGSSASGSFVQRGGHAQFGRLLVSYAGSAQGCYEIFGGVLDVPYLDNNTRFRIGHAGSGQFLQHGGTVNFAANRTSVDDVAAPEIGSSRANVRRAVWYADGGFLDCHNSALFIHGYSADAPQGAAEMTLQGAARAKIKNVVFRGKQGSGKGQPGFLNLLDGAELVTGSVRSRMASSPQKWDAVNIRDARIETSGTSSGDYDFFGNTDAVTLYGGVFEFCCNKGITMLGGDVPTNLRTAKGYGVESLALTAGGSKFWVPPIVTISGGSGSNATAVAFIDYDTGSVTGLVVTCRGEGYAADDVLTVTIENPSATRGSGATATATLAPNPGDGTLLKTGPSRLVVYDQVNFDGTLEVREGSVIQSTTRTNGLQSIRKIIVGGPGTPSFQTSSGGQAAYTANTSEAEGAVNPAAELQIGTANGPGQIAGGGGIEGTVFTQRFAKLSVKGPGGILEGSPASYFVNATHSLRFIFDDYECAPGATLTVGEGAGFSVVFPNATPGAILPGIHVGSSKLPATVDENHILRGLTSEELDATAASDANLHISTSQTLSGDLSTLAISYPSALTLTIDGALNLADGQLTVGGLTNGSGSVKITGGELTSGSGILDVYDYHVVNRRNNGGSEVFGTAIGSKLVDGTDKPLTLAVTGRPWPEGSQSLATGPCVKLSNEENAYSGGTYIHDTALAVPSDSVLGPAPATVTNNIFTSGMAMIRAPFDSNDKATLDLAATRGICVQGGYLGLFGGKDGQSSRMVMRVNGPISGQGTIGIGQWSGTGYASLVEFAGDNSAFRGTLALIGRLRIAGEKALPPCGILLAEREARNTEGGMLCMQGAFSLPCGTNLEREVSWRCVNSAYNKLVGTESGIGGGFAAWGGPLTVNLGGKGETLVYKSEAFSPFTLRLQDDFATEDLTWMNAVQINEGDTLTVHVSRNAETPRARWCGALTGGGTLLKQGKGIFALADGGDVASGITLNLNGNFHAVVTNTLTIGGTVVNAAGFRKQGEGVVTASGTWENSGPMYVDEGTLLLDGAVTGKMGVAVAAAGTLGGTGSLTLDSGTSVTVEGSVLVQKTGSLAVTGDVVFGAGATLVAADESVFENKKAVLTALTYMGTLTGAPKGVDLPSGWTVRAGNGSVRVRYTDGTMVIFR